MELGHMPMDVTETLFNIPLRAVRPSRPPTNDTIDNLSGLVTGVILACDVDLRMDLYNNILLYGGTSLIPNLRDRVEREVLIFNGKVINAKGTLPPDPWQGGSILASLGTFKEMWISRSEYDESGPAIVHRKY